MNAMDVRVIGASALTAVAVSLTVVWMAGTRRECAPAPPVVITVPATAAAPLAPRDVAPRDVDDADDVDDAVSDDLGDDADDSNESDDTDTTTNDDTRTTNNNCDAEALKERGMQNINMGQHAAALAMFEASLRCALDPYVVQLAFMESCASSNSAKAKLYYQELTPAQQTKFAQICIRQKPPVAYE